MPNYTGQANATKTTGSKISNRNCSRKISSPWESASYDDVMNGIKNGDILPYTAWTWIDNSTSQA